VDKKSCPQNSHISCLLADFWQTFGKLLADFWLTFGKLLADFWPTFGQLFGNA